MTTEPSTSIEAMQSQRDIELIVPADGDIVTSEIEIKRSRFITWVAHVDDEGSVRETINLTRAECPDVCHHCSIYIHEVVRGDRVERSLGDSELDGTAGRPMFGVLQGSGVADVTAIVIRYFGGTKLGTGGLVRAYSDSVSECLEKVTHVWCVQRALRAVSISAADTGYIGAELCARDYEIIEARWGQDVEFSTAAVADGIAQLDGKIQVLTKGISEPSADGGKIWWELHT